MDTKLIISPKPSYIRVGEKFFDFDGFKNFPDSLMEIFEIPRGKWKIVKVEENGNGLRVSKPGEVLIWGDARVAYATLVQLIAQTKKKIPEIEIEENFDFEFRAYHMDIARGGVPKVETFKKILRWLFLLKYTHFGIYFEDLFDWQKYPSLGAHRGKLKREELEEIINYAKKLGVDVFPSLELTGHMEHILSLKEFRRFSEWHNPHEGCIDLSNRNAREFTYELLEEVINFFPSKYVHVGGDETWALGRGKSLNTTWKFQGVELYESHYEKLTQMVKDHGKIPMAWGDMLTGMYLSKSERKLWSKLAKSKVWQGALIANWDYAPRNVEEFEKEIELLKSRKQIISPGFSNWNTFYPDFSVALSNVRNFLEAAKNKGINSYMVTSWGDDGQECLFSFLPPMLVATAEYACGNNNWEESWKKLAEESEDAFAVRVMFGNAKIGELKRFLFSELRSPKPMQLSSTTIELWEKAVEFSKHVKLEDDMRFIVNLLECGVRMARKELSKENLMDLSEEFITLWKAERKPEGLKNIVAKFWAMAGILSLRYNRM